MKSRDAIFFFFAQPFNSRFSVQAATSAILVPMSRFMDAAFVKIHGCSVYIPKTEWRRKICKRGVCQLTALKKQMALIAHSLSTARGRTVLT